MHLFSAYAFARDRRFQQSLVRALQSPRLQFAETPAGAWVWRVRQDPAPEDVGALVGPFAEMCRLLGVPAVRLRAAIPEELLAGDIGAGPIPASPERERCKKSAA